MKLTDLIRTAPEEFHKSLQAEYDKLYKRSEILYALENGGVDNWEWYDDSIRDYFGDEEEE